MDFVVSEQERPKRRAAKNALYRACPTCDRKFLLTEIEFHVNLCIEKMEKQAAKLLKPEKVQVKVKASSSFKADHSVCYLLFFCEKRIYFFFFFCVFF